MLSPPSPCCVQEPGGAGAPLPWARPRLAAGQELEIQLGGEWCRATVAEALGGDSYTLHVPGEWDESVLVPEEQPEEQQLEGEEGPPSPPPSTAEAGGGGTAGSPAAAPADCDAAAVAAGDDVDASQDGEEESEGSEGASEEYEEVAELRVQVGAGWDRLLHGLCL